MRILVNLLLGFVIVATIIGVCEYFIKMQHEHEEKMLDKYIKNDRRKFLIGRVGDWVINLLTSVGNLLPT